MSEDTANTALHPQLVISPSKAHRILFTKLRDKDTSSEDFVKYSKRSMRLVVEDALAEFPSRRITISTPCGPYNDGLESIINDSNETNLCAVSIIRSGDALLEVVRDVLPGCKVGKILIQRDESHPDKIPKFFYCKLPPDLTKKEDNDVNKDSAPKNKTFILLCDPMLATGGSAITALDLLVNDYGVDPKHIIFANMICAPEGLQLMAKKYPDVKIVTAFVDEKLNEDKYIVPGLGDYGDRFFNT